MIYDQWFRERGRMRPEKPILNGRAGDPLLTDGPLRTALTPVSLRPQPTVTEPVYSHGSTFDFSCAPEQTSFQASLPTCTDWQAEFEPGTSLSHAIRCAAYMPLLKPEVDNIPYSGMFPDIGHFSLFDNFELEHADQRSTNFLTTVPGPQVSQTWVDAGDADQVRNGFSIPDGHFEDHSLRDRYWTSSAITNRRMAWDRIAHGMQRNLVSTMLNNMREMEATQTTTTTAEERYVARLLVRTFTLSHEQIAKFDALRQEENKASEMFNAEMGRIGGSIRSVLTMDPTTQTLECSYPSLWTEHFPKKPEYCTDRNSFESVARAKNFVNLLDLHHSQRAQIINRLDGWSGLSPTSLFVDVPVRMTYVEEVLKRMKKHEPAKAAPDRAKGTRSRGGQRSGMPSNARPSSLPAARATAALSGTSLLQSASVLETRVTNQKGRFVVGRSIAAQVGQENTGQTQNSLITQSSSEQQVPALSANAMGKREAVDDTHDTPPPAPRLRAAVPTTHSGEILGLPLTRNEDQREGEPPRVPSADLSWVANKALFAAEARKAKVAKKADRVLMEGPLTPNHLQKVSRLSEEYYRKEFDASSSEQMLASADYARLAGVADLADFADHAEEASYICL